MCVGGSVLLDPCGPISADFEIRATSSDPEEHQNYAAYLHRHV